MAPTNRFAKYSAPEDETPAGNRFAKYTPGVIVEDREEAPEQSGPLRKGAAPPTRAVAPRPPALLRLPEGRDEEYAKGLAENEAAYKAEEDKKLSNQFLKGAGVSLDKALKTDHMGGLVDLGAAAAQGVASLPFLAYDYLNETPVNQVANDVSRVVAEGTGAPALARMQNSGAIQMPGVNKVAEDSLGKVPEGYDPSIDAALLPINAFTWYARGAGGRAIQPKFIGPPKPPANGLRGFVGEVAPHVADAATNLTMGASDVASAAARKGGLMASTATRALTNGLTAPPDRAAYLANRALKRDNVTTDMLRKEKAKLDKMGGGIEETFPELSGKNTRGLARVLASTPGEGADAAQKLATMRREQLGGQASKALGKATGQDASKYTDDIEDLIEARKQASAPAYEAFYASPVDEGVFTRKIRPVLDTDPGKDALNRAKRALAFEAQTTLAAGDKAGSDSLANAAREIDAYLANGAPLGPRALDAVKKGFDDIIDVSAREGGKNNARLLGTAKRNLAFDIDSATGGTYGNALGTYSGPTRIREMIDIGRKAMTMKDWELNEVLKGSTKYGTLTGEEIEGLSKGLTRAFQDAINENDRAFLSKFLRNKGLQNKLQAVIGDDKAFKQFRNQFLRISGRVQHGDFLTQGSPTARIAAEQADAAGEDFGTRFLSNVERGQGLKESIVSAVWKPIVGKINEAYRLLRYRGVGDEDVNKTLTRYLIGTTNDKGVFTPNKMTEGKLDELIAWLESGQKKSAPKTLKSTPSPGSSGPPKAIAGPPTTPAPSTPRSPPDQASLFGGGQKLDMSEAGRRFVEQLLSAGVPATIASVGPEGEPLEQKIPRMLAAMGAGLTIKNWGLVRNVFKSHSEKALDAFDAKYGPEQIAKVLKGEELESFKKVWGLDKPPVRGTDDADQMTFGGINAKTADKQALAKAEKLEASGADRDTIWKETGWYKGTDGKWRFEIDDRNVQPRTSAVFREKGKLRDFVSDADAGGAYPHLDDLETRRIDERGGSYGVPMWGEGADGPPRLAFGGVGPEARTTILHERQHGVQDTEGFARGGSPTFAPYKFRDPKDQARWDAAHKEISGIMKAVDIPDLSFRAQKAAEYAQRTDIGEDSRRYFMAKKPGANEMPYLTRWQELRAELDELEKRAIPSEDVYHRLAGEVEARNVQKRRNWSPEKRRRIPPWETQDVPDDRQFVTYETTTAESRPPGGSGKSPPGKGGGGATAKDVDFSQPLYHGTFRSGDSFGPFSHLGTKRAAKDRLADGGPKGSKRTLHEVRIKPGRVLDMGEDTGVEHTPQMFIQALAKAKVFTPDELKHIAEPIDVAKAERVPGVELTYNGYDPYEEAAKRAADVLDQKGIVAFRYSNAVEDPGSYSYVVPNPKNIQRATPPPPNRPQPTNGLPQKAGKTGEGPKGPPKGKSFAPRVVRELGRAKTLPPEVQSKIIANGRRPPQERLPVIDAAEQAPGVFAMAAPFQGRSGLDTNIAAARERAGAIPPAINLEPLMNAAQTAKANLTKARRDHSTIHDRTIMKDNRDELRAAALARATTAEDVYAAAMKDLEAGRQATTDRSAIAELASRRLAEIDAALRTGPASMPSRKPVIGRPGGKRGEANRGSRMEAEEINRLLFTPEGAETFAKILAGELTPKPGSQWHEVLHYAKTHPVIAASALAAATGGPAAMVSSLAQGGDRPKDEGGPVTPQFSLPDNSYHEDPLRNSMDYRGVTEAQTIMRDLGAPIKVDGIMIRKDGRETDTQRLLKQIQEANGLTPTGLLDDETIALLGELHRAKLTGRSAARRAPGPPSRTTPALGPPP